tara:strand:- start:240 stop:407 length:168 start_codon:yes stop_codon:yes gene_type:complete
MRILPANAAEIPSANLEQFNLLVDPNETKNLAKAHPKIVGDLWVCTTGWLPVVQH